MPRKRPDSTGMGKGPNKKAGETGPNVRLSGKFDAKAKRKFLAYVRKHGYHIASAAQSVGVTSYVVFSHQKTDPEFAEAMDAARQVYVESLSHEIHRRGVNGWEEPIYYKGECVGKVRKYSDQLLTLLARRWDPAYRESVQVDQTTKIEGEVRTTLSELSGMDADTLKQLKEIIKKKKGK